MNSQDPCGYECTANVRNIVGHPKNCEPHRNYDRNLLIGEPIRSKKKWLTFQLCIKVGKIKDNIWYESSLKETQQSSK